MGPFLDNETGEVDCELFDQAIGQTILIIVSYDMGWSKRGNGRSYDSLNGYGAMIGFLTGKVLDYTTRNRRCRMCDQGSKKIHDCRKIFTVQPKQWRQTGGKSWLTVVKY